MSRYNLAHLILLMLEGLILITLMSVIRSLKRAPLHVSDTVISRLALIRSSAKIVEKLFTHKFISQSKLILSRGIYRGHFGMSRMYIGHTVRPQCVL